MTLSERASTIERRARVQLFGLALLGCLAAVAQSSPAEAGQCGQLAQVGSWVNEDPNTRGITRVELRQRCEDDTRTTCGTNGLCTTISGVRLRAFIRLFGACVPQDCEFGEVEGAPWSGGGGWYLFRYEQGFASRDVYARVESGQLRVFMFTDFADPARADYTVDEFFVRSDVCEAP